MALTQISVNIHCLFQIIKHPFQSGKLGSDRFPLCSVFVCNNKTPARALGAGISRVIELVTRWMSVIRHGQSRWDTARTALRSHSERCSWQVLPPGLGRKNQQLTELSHRGLTKNGAFSQLPLGLHTGARADPGKMNSCQTNSE